MIRDFLRNQLGLLRAKPEPKPEPKPSEVELVYERLVHQAAEALRLDGPPSWSNCLALMEDDGKRRHRLQILERTLEQADKRIAELTGTIGPVAKDFEGLGADRPPAEVVCYSSIYHCRGDALGHGNFRAFATPLGQVYSANGSREGTRTFNRSDTNQREGGRLCGAVEADVKAVHVEIIGGGSEDVDQIKNAVLTWDFLQVSLEVMPLGAFAWDSSGRRGVHIAAGVRLASDMTFGMVLQYGASDHAVAEDVKIRISLLCERVGEGKVVDFPRFAYPK